MHEDAHLRRYSRKADTERINAVLIKALPEYLITALPVLQVSQV